MRRPWRGRHVAAPAPVAPGVGLLGRGGLHAAAGPAVNTTDRDLLTRILRRLVISERGCWIWTGACSSRGSLYGHVNVGGRSVKVHRLMYSMLVGPIPNGLVLDHLCLIPQCCNPSHLEPVTNAENRRRARKSHCRKGHLLTEDNTYYRPDTGGRQCLACVTRRNRSRSRKEVGAAR